MWIRKKLVQDVAIATCLMLAQPGHAAVVRRRLLLGVDGHADQAGRLPSLTHKGHPPHRFPGAVFAQGGSVPSAFSIVVLDIWSIPVKGLSSS